MKDHSSKTEQAAELTRLFNGFEQHIIYCCRAPEFELRKWLKKVLTRAGFRLIEDNYQTDRIKEDPRYRNVHNLVAIRGENPQVCLVAHTDVCREHAKKISSTGVSYPNHDDFVRWQKKPSSKSEFESLKDAILKKDEPYRVDPVLKLVVKDGITKRIVQDRLCKFQVGGDDRLGVAIITWLALNTGYDMGLYFPTDEEIGLKSARMCEIPELKNFQLLAQVDRGNKSNELVSKIQSQILCDFETLTRLLTVAYQMGKPRSVVVGANTDIFAIKERGWCKNAVNMTCGYHDSFSSGANEYIDVEEAKDTLHYVSEIVKSYYLDPAVD